MAFDNPADQDIRELLERSRTVAVVGLSDDPGRPSHGVARSLQRSGFRIFPVNPNLNGPVLGEEPYDSVEEVPGPVDIVDVFRRSEEILPVAEGAVAVGAKIFWTQLGVVNREAAHVAEQGGLIVVMDRCLAVEYGRLVGR